MGYHRIPKIIMNDTTTTDCLIFMAIWTAVCAAVAAAASIAFSL
jgi:hypothetical protein